MWVERIFTLCHESLFLNIFLEINKILLELNGLHFMSRVGWNKSDLSSGLTF